MGVPEADDHRRSLPGDTTGGPSQDTELGHGTRQQPLLDQGASHGSPGPALKQRQLGRNSRNLKGNYLCKTPVPKQVAGALEQNSNLLPAAAQQAPVERGRLRVDSGSYGSFPELRVPP